MGTARCVDCGYVVERRARDGAFTALTELQRGEVARRYLDETLICFVEFEGFTWDKVRETIECPFYMRRIPGLSPVEHIEMQQILESRQQADQAAASQRREARIIATITITLTVAAVIVGALIGRGLSP